MARLPILQKPSSYENPKGFAQDLRRTMDPALPTKVGPQDDKLKGGKVMRKIAAIFLILLFLHAHPAYASPSANPTPAGASAFGCTQTGIFNFVVRCSEQMITSLAGYQVQESATGNLSLLQLPSAAPFVQKLSGYFTSINLILLTLYLVLFGYKLVSGGVRDIRSEGMMVIIKFSFVAYMSLGFGFAQVYPMFFSLMQWVVNIFSIAPVQNGSCSDPNSYPDVWRRADCIINYFYGLNTGSSAKYMLFAIGPAILLSGGTGLIIFGLIAFGCLMIAASFSVAAFSYIMAELGITFLFAFAPIIFPLMLFGRPVNGIFKKWLHVLLAISLEPMVVIGYLTLMLTILNSVMFGDGINVGVVNLFQTAYNSITSVTMIPVLNINIPNMSADWWNNQAVYFLINILAAVVTLYLLFSFMLNVVSFANQLLGLSPQHDSLGSNVNALKGVMRAGQSMVDMAKNLKSL